MISATGVLRAVATVDVGSELSGQVALLHADFNDSVVLGQTLVELDRRGFEARLVQAEAELAMAGETVSLLEARLDKARGVERENVTRRRVFAAQLKGAAVRADAAGKRHDRTKALSARGAASKSTLEEARADRDAAAASVGEARAAAEAHEHVVAASRAGRREAEAELASAKAALPLRAAAVTLAGLDIERATIRAPIDGVVVGRNVERGQTVAASLDAPVLFTIAGDLSRMEIHAAIDETDIAKIAPGQTAAFTVDAFPGRAFAARVDKIRKAAVTVKGVVAYTVVLKADNADGLLLPGMTATVRIAYRVSDDAPSIPLAALGYLPSGDTVVPPATADDTRTVWVLENGTPRPRRLRLGADDGRDVAVLDGALSAGERVIVGEAPAETEGRILGIRFQ